MSKNIKLEIPQNTVSSITRKTYLTAKTLWISGLSIFCLIGGITIAYIQPFILIGAIGGIISLIMLIYQPFLGVLGYIIYEYANVAKMFPAIGAIQAGKLIIVLTLFIFQTIRCKAVCLLNRLT